MLLLTLKLCCLHTNYAATQAQGFMLLQIGYLLLIVGYLLRTKGMLLLTQLCCYLHVGYPATYT